MKIRMYRAFGLVTGRVYAEGTEEGVRTLLQKRYPSLGKAVDGREVRRDPVYPEPIMISRI